jgi:hypothetical protein
MSRISGPIEVRAALALTNSYVAGTQYDVERADGATIIVDYTIGSSTSIEIKVELSPDTVGTAAGSSEWAQTLDPADGTLREWTFSATGKFAIELPESGGILTANKLRVLVKCTGTVTSSVTQVQVMSSV